MTFMNIHVFRHSCFATFMYSRIPTFRSFKTHSLEITVPYLHSCGHSICYVRGIYWRGTLGHYSSTNTDSAERCQVPLHARGAAAAPNLYLRKHVLATLPQVSPSLRAPPPRLNPALAALGKRALLNCLERNLGHHARKHVLPRASRSGKTCSRRLPPPRLNLSPARHT
jgi:hypothetical protein